MSRSRDKGTRWETALVDYLQQHWPHIERRALNGNRDRGDIAGLPGVIIEAKSAQRIELAEWMKEAQAETANAQAELGAVWIKRRGKTSAGDGYVVLDGHTFTKLLKLAGW